MKYKQSFMLLLVLCCGLTLGWQDVNAGMNQEEMVRGLMRGGTRGPGGIVDLPDKDETQKPQEEQSQGELSLLLKFGIDSASLTPSAVAELRTLAAALEDTRLRDYKFQLEGHTCDLGSTAHNMELSKRRAYAAADWLTNHTSLSPEQFEVLWFGESRPAVENTDENARRQNRRVVVRNTGEIPEISVSSKPAMLEIIRHTAHGPVVIGDGDKISSGERYSLNFTSSGKSYAYVCQMDSTGKTDVLFPNPKYSNGTNPIQQGTRYALPGENKAFYLDTKTGIENVVVLALDMPLKNPQLACESVLKNKKQHQETLARRGLGGIAPAEPMIKDGHDEVAAGEKMVSVNLCETMYGGETRSYVGATRGLGGIASADSPPTADAPASNETCQGFVLKRFFLHN